MKLRAYLKEHDISDEALSALAGGSFSAEAVRKWRFGVRTPRPAQMAKLAELTNGAVTANDFMPSVPGRNLSDVGVR